MARRRGRLRPTRSDDLGLRRALSDRLLPSLVGAMAFLAALAGAGVFGAEAMARHWRLGAGAAITVQVPDPARDNRLGRVLAALRGAPGVADARPLDAAEMESLLRPWLGEGANRLALPLPAVVAVRLDATGEDGTAPDSAALAALLDAAAPGSLTEGNAPWLRRLRVLARSLQACAALAMATVGFVAASVVLVATRAGLAARRDAIEIVHGLGATDGYIAGQFARRTTALAGWGALVGTLVAIPVLAGLGGLAAPFAGGAVPEDAAAALLSVPAPLWGALPALPLLAATLGWVTAQVTVRRWLRRLP